MEKKQPHYKMIHRLSSLFMLLALAWLTICLPYVNENRLAVKSQIQLTSEECPENENSNPLSNTNEEKSEGGVSLLSEYLHNPFHMEHSFFGIASLYKCHPSDLYLAYHPDLIIPPPEA